jgi:hypothetical protein
MMRPVTRVRFNAQPHGLFSNSIDHMLKAGDKGCSALVFDPAAGLVYVTMRNEVHVFHASAFADIVLDGGVIVQAPEEPARTAKGETAKK